MTELPLETLYDGPTRSDVLMFAGKSVRLARPAEPDRLLDAPDVLAHNRRDDYMPYWAYLWPGAFLLAEAVARESWPPGTKALEIGCGLGLAGLTALSAGVESVTFSDYDRAPLRFVERSLQENGIAPERASTLVLDWRAIPEGLTAPIVFGADVLYETRLVPLVSALLKTVLEPDGWAWVAGPYRVATEGLPAALAEHGLTCEAHPITAPGETPGSTVNGTLHRIWRSRSRG